MRAAVLACWLGLLLSASTASAQDRVLVRTSLDPGRVVVGQQTRLLVDVLFPGDMPHPPRIPAPEIEGAQVFRFESQATNLNETVGRHAYVGQRFEFDLYPRRAGTLHVPPVQVTLLDQAGGATGTLTGTEQTVQATVPPGLDASQPIVAADHVTLRETWQPKAQKVHVGDALTRTITRSAQGIPGLALANLTFSAPDGVRAYVDPPSINDRVERGEVAGERTDRVTYVFERAGTFVLPGVIQPWWNLAARRAESLSRPALSVVVQASAVRHEAPRASPFARGVPIWGAVIVAIVLLLVAGLWRLLVSRPAEAGRSDSEQLAFKALRKGVSARHSA